MMGAETPRSCTPAPIFGLGSETEVPMVLSENTKRIAELDDRLRRFGSGGEIMMTQGVMALPPTAIMKAVAAMRSFTDFSEDNNPYQEHDFGKFDADGHEFFF